MAKTTTIITTTTATMTTTTTTTTPTTTTTSTTTTTTNTKVTTTSTGNISTNGTTSDTGTAAPLVFTNEQFCELDKGHTMCIYSGPGGVCLGDPNRKSGLTAEGKARVLDKHNELRSLVARGEQPGQPQAANMRRLLWSHELETVAQRWADQCIFGHDKVKTKLDGTYVGQNG